MANLLHANAKTTPRVRKEIQESKESLASLANKYGINIKTVIYWKKAVTTEDKRSGPKKPKSSLSDVEQQILVEFRRSTKLSLDEVFIAFKEKIPHLSRSGLHRLFKRNGISVLPKETTEKEKKKFKEYKPGFIHIDITEARINTQKYYIFVAIDRATKYIYAEIYDKMTTQNACIFLENCLKEYPFIIEKILTDNGSQFSYNCLAYHSKIPESPHLFDQICQKNNIKHRTTKFKHPWTNGQVEITNKMIKNATIKKFHYENINELKQHLMAFLLYYNHQKPCIKLKYIPPFKKIIEYYKNEPNLFKENPMEKIVGLNS